jgi:hypothetical protein
MEYLFLGVGVISAIILDVAFSPSPPALGIGHLIPGIRAITRFSERGVHLCLFQA